MHWCADEQVALLTVLGMIPFLGPWLRAKWQKFKNPHCCKKEHNDAGLHG